MSITCDTKSQYLTCIQERLAELVHVDDPSQAQLIAAARHALLGPGKRLRPMLCLATARCLGATIECALTPACALELVHCYSLIHDDLPCMDDDDLRRGLPTVHRAFGEWQAVLAGDYLLTRAFDCLADSPCLSDGQRLELVRCLGQAAGAHGMIGGQVIDLESEGLALELEELQRLHLLKTGAMICAALDFGAIVAGADAKTRSALRAFGQKIGLAFQVVDDVLDVTNEERKGRCSDAENNKATYVSLLGVEAARRCAERLHAEALDALVAVEGDISELHVLADAIIQRTY